jgi:hypothetical protein
MPSAPLVSVVMPVRNALPYLDQSIRSILDQSHRRVELVIRDDGSTDGSGRVLRAWARRDRRIRLFHGPESLGPAESSNWVVRQARAAFVARMDADDVSHPDRLRRQLAVFERHPDVVLVGSLYEGIDLDARRVRGPDLRRLAAPSPMPPFPHGSVMFRRDAFDRVGGYRRACDYWEDLDLFLRLAAVGRVLVLPDALYRYRFTTASVRLASEADRVEAAVALMYRCLDEHVHGRSYEPLLDGTEQGAQLETPPARCPRALLARGALRLWSGGSPQTLMALLRTCGLRPSGLRALAWSAVGAVSPKALRGASAAFVAMRTRQLRERFVEGTAYEWRSAGPARA